MCLVALSTTDLTTEIPKVMIISKLTTPTFWGDFDTQTVQELFDSQLSKSFIQTQKISVWTFTCMNKKTARK